MHRIPYQEYYIKIRFLVWEENSLEGSGARVRGTRKKEEKRKHACRWSYGCHCCQEFHFDSPCKATSLLLRSAAALKAPAAAICSSSFVTINCQKLLFPCNAGVDSINLKSKYYSSRSLTLLLWHRQDVM